MLGGGSEASAEHAARLKHFAALKSIPAGFFQLWGQALGVSEFLVTACLSFQPGLAGAESQQQNKGSPSPCSKASTSPGVNRAQLPVPLRGWLSVNIQKIKRREEGKEGETHKTHTAIASVQYKHPAPTDLSSLTAAEQTEVVQSCYFNNEIGDGL